MFLPLERRINDRRPWATFGLVAVNTVAFFALYWSAGSIQGLQALWERYGYTPAHPYTPSTVTHLFIHANWAHLIGNMLFLIFMGMNCERRLGPAAYLALYFLSGFGALALFSSFNSSGTVPLGGASGAISGVAGVYLALFARREVEVFWFALVTAGTLRTPAWLFSLLWAGCEVAQAALLNGTKHNVANMAHVGGFMVGLGGAAMLLRLFGFRGYPEIRAPRAASARRRDTFEELAYIPLKTPSESTGRPDTAVIPDLRRQTFALVARQTGPLPAPAETILGVSGKAPEGGPRPACLARGIDFPAAENLQIRLQEAGYPAVIIPERTLINVPPLVPLAALALEGQKILLGDDLGQTYPRDLNTLYMMSAGRVRTPAGGERTFLDLFTTSPWTDFRLTEGDLPALARELMLRAGRVPAAKSFVSLAREGQIPGELFSDLTAYDAFNLWMLQIYASGVYRKPTD